MKTILLSDDNRDSREIYGTMFTHHGFRVMEAEDGVTALRLAREEHPDLVVLNLFMPTMDGQTVLRELRADPETEDMLCLLLTGDSRPEQMGEALINGADAYLTKPVAPSRVLDFVRQILGEGRDGS